MRVEPIEILPSPPPSCHTSSSKRKGHKAAEKMPWFESNSPTMQGLQGEDEEGIVENGCMLRFALGSYAWYCKAMKTPRWKCCEIPVPLLVTGCVAGISAVYCSSFCSFTEREKLHRDESLCCTAAPRNAIKQSPPPKKQMLKCKIKMKEKETNIQYPPKPSDLIYSSPKYILSYWILNTVSNLNK